MITRRLQLLAVAVGACTLGSLSFASIVTRGSRQTIPPSSEPRETQLWHSPFQDLLQYSLVSHTSSRSRCEADRPPEALATPDPLTDTTDGPLRVTVSFIVGTDGRVHSPFILESAGPVEDRTVLQAVKRWRYRPALCNGVPTEVEAKIEFSAR